MVLLPHYTYDTGTNMNTEASDRNRLSA